MQSADTAKWCQQHPEVINLTAEFQKLNKHENTTPDERQMAFDVYLDLCEDKNWMHVELKYSSTLNKIYLIGIARKNDPQRAILPIKGENGLSIAEIKEIINHLQESANLTSVTLAITGSIIVYYNLGDNPLSILA